MTVRVSLDHGKLRVRGVSYYEMRTRSDGGMLIYLEFQVAPPSQVRQAIEQLYPPHKFNAAGDAIHLPCSYIEITHE